MSDISRVVFFTEDKNVGKLLRSLVGVAVQQPTVEPVHNAKASKNGLVPATSGELVEMFREHCIRHKTKKVTADQLKAFVQSVGRPESAHTTLRAMGQDVGLLKKQGHGRSVHYVVQAATPKMLRKKSGGSK